MSWGIEFQVLTSRYKKDCCSFVLFINRIVSMREVELQVGRECQTLDFVKYWFRLHGCCLWYKLYVILPAPYSKSLFSFKTFKLVYEGFALEFHFVWVNDLNSFVLENRNFLEIRFVGRTPYGNCIETMRIN